MYHAIEYREHVPLYMLSCSERKKSINSEDAHSALWVSFFEIAFSSVLSTNGIHFETNKTIKCLNSQFQIRSLSSNYHYYCFYLCAFIVRILYIFIYSFSSLDLPLLNFIFFNTRLSTLMMAAAVVKRTAIEVDGDSSKKNNNNRGSVLFVAVLSKTVWNFEWNKSCGEWME